MLCTSSDVMNISQLAVNPQVILCLKCYFLEGSYLQEICSESSGSVPLLHGHREKAGKSHMSQLQIASYQSPWMRGKAGPEAPGKLLSTEEQPKEGRIG